jgi:RHH-type proline utilization regulon transcriptional repressor/proline dehydrogenase/delta 1-pyrroline-5-carboxylate dehydrogenase
VERSSNLSLRRTPHARPQPRFPAFFFHRLCRRPRSASFGAARTGHRSLSVRRTGSGAALAGKGAPAGRPGRRSARAGPPHRAQPARTARRPVAAPAWCRNLLQEYALSSQEGVALMCLAEALLRIPDAATRDALIRDKISAGPVAVAPGQEPVAVRQRRDLGPADHRQAGVHAQRKRLSSALTRLIGKGGEPLIRKGVDMAMRLMGEQFVTGETISEALANARKLEARGLPLFLRHAGRSGADRGRRAALPHRPTRGDPRDRQGLGRPRHLRRAGHLDQAVGAASALQPRAARARDGELYPCCASLALLAPGYDIGLNIDAEEADRLELSLDLLERCASSPNWPAGTASASWSRPTRSAARS